MRRSEEDCVLPPGKQTFVDAMTRALRSVPAVVSVTFTGSFIDREDLSGISDIDVVVLVRRLTADTFAACRGAVGSVSPDLLGLQKHALRINDTFGPLKFDEPGVVVVHLMVYDLAGHRDHVLLSPFTCLDWERSGVVEGPSLREVYPVLRLQPRDFVEARRGLRNYVEDLEAGVVSYRRYDFRDGKPTLVLDRMGVDGKAAGEFAYHIVRNTMTNYLKLIDGRNTTVAAEELGTRWKAVLPQTARHVPFFEELVACKLGRSRSFPVGSVERCATFLSDFEAELDQVWTRQATRVVFVRHGRTGLNDGSFLGQRRDPALVAQAIEGPPERAAKWDSVWSSPLLRARQTAGFLAPGENVKVDVRLSEIDYGAAEGMTLGDLEREFPSVPAAWRAGQDVPFPGGESSGDVCKRLDGFLADLAASPAAGPVLVVSHNVVLRCLLGHAYDLPISKWHLIPVDHLEQLEFLSLHGRLFPNLTRDQKGRLTDSVQPALVTF
jgi:broad specificity phosphatase PhoE